MRSAAGPGERGCQDHLSRLNDGIEFDILIRVMRARADWPEQQGRNAKLRCINPASHGYGAAVMMGGLPITAAALPAMQSTQGWLRGSSWPLSGD